MHKCLVQKEKVAEVSREQHTEVLFMHAVSWQSERAQMENGELGEISDFSTLLERFWHVKDNRKVRDCVFQDYLHSGIIIPTAKCYRFWILALSKKDWQSKIHFRYLYIITEAESTREEFANTKYKYKVIQHWSLVVFPDISLSLSLGCFCYLQE